MEEPQTPIDSVDEHSAKTAEMLRTMREQADEALQSHRQIIESVEAELNRRIQQIAEELAQDRTADEMEIAALRAQSEEIDKVRESLGKAEKEKAGLRDQLKNLTADQQAEASAHADQLQQLSEERDQLQQERDSLSEELGQALTDQLKSSEELGELAEQLANLQEDLDHTSQERDQFSERFQELGETHEELTLERNRVVDELEQLHTERDQLAEEHIRLADEMEQVLLDAEENDCQRDRLIGELEGLSAQHETLRAERDQMADQLEQLLADAEQEDGELEALRGQHEVLQGERDQLAEQLSQLRADVEQKASQTQQLSSEQEQLEAQHAQLTKERNELVDQFQQLQAQHVQISGERDQLAGELQTVQEEKDSECARLGEELSAVKENLAHAQQQSESLESQLQALQQESGQASQSLEETRAASDELNHQLAEKKQLVAELSEQFEQLKADHEQIIAEQQEHLEQSERKCELTLADVHKLKKANAELHEELVRRPETDDHDSPELVSLRAERDALATRVEELESAPASGLDEEDGQELSDLQRRFEMAVEDVRNLKQENASLREQLEASPPVSVTVSDAGDMGWQAQKERLLASLDAEDDGGQITPERREELTTIEGTISITDQVMSEKDREIARLKKQLENRPAEVASEVDVEAVREEALKLAHDELFEKDEIIQTERERLEQLQNEWNEKLRTAELEISVQRATLAREKAKMDEKLALLETEVAEIQKNGGKPKQRWLTALGLNDKEEEKKD